MHPVTVLEHSNNPITNGASSPSGLAVEHTYWKGNPHSYVTIHPKMYQRRGRTKYCTEERVFSSSKSNTSHLCLSILPVTLRNTSTMESISSPLESLSSCVIKAPHYQQRFSSRAVPASRNHGKKRADSNPDRFVVFPGTIWWLWWSSPRSLTDFRSTVVLTRKTKLVSVAMVGCSGYRTHKDCSAADWNSTASTVIGV